MPDRTPVAPREADRDPPSEPAPEPQPPTGADRIRAIGEAAERMAGAMAQREAEPYRKRILADFETRRSHNRHVRKHLFEMARRFEDYPSVYDCARELRDFVESLGGPPKTRPQRRRPA